jgi:hypothetical protein
MLRRIVLGILSGLGAIVIAFAWLLVGVYTPSLTRTQAAAMISARPEFNRYATLVDVSSTARGGDSLKNSLYFADFTFRQNGSPNIIPAHAEFYWHEKSSSTWMIWAGKWRLGDFSYGGESVHVGADEPALPFSCSVQPDPEPSASPPSGYGCNA